MTVEAFAGQLDKLGQGKALEALLRRELIRTGLEAQAGAMEKAGERLNVRSGFLRRSIAFRVEGDAAAPELIVSAGGGRGNRGELRYAAIQEYGGTVVPKKGQWLAIPVGPALTPAGVARFATARDVPDLRFIRLPGGGAILAKVKPGKKGQPSQLTVYFDLRRSVTLRGRYYMLQGVKPAFDAFQPRLAAQVVAAVGAA